MTAIRIVFLLTGGLLIGAGNAAAETADCRAQLKQQDEQCQVLAEKLAAACPSGTNIKETAQCREVSSQIAIDLHPQALRAAAAQRQEGEVEGHGRQQAGQKGCAEIQVRA